VETAVIAAIIAANGASGRKARPLIFHGRFGDFPQSGFFL
jgi:hypothetical protein